jgi:hypothetical protein
MSAKKIPVVENNIKHSVSPIRDVLVVPPGAISTVEEESMHSHPALLVEQRIMSEVKPKSPKSPKSSSTTPSSHTTNTGNNISAPIKEDELPKKIVSPSPSPSPNKRRPPVLKKRKRARGIKTENRKKKRTRRAGGGKGTRKKYNRKLRITRGGKK